MKKLVLIVMSAFFIVALNGEAQEKIGEAKYEYTAQKAIEADIQTAHHAYARMAIMESVLVSEGRSRPSNQQQMCGSNALRLFNSYAMVQSEFLRENGCMAIYDTATDELLIAMTSRMKDYTTGKEVSARQLTLNEFMRYKNEIEELCRETLRNSPAHRKFRVIAVRVVSSRSMMLSMSEVQIGNNEDFFEYILYTKELGEGAWTHEHYQIRRVAKGIHRIDIPKKPQGILLSAELLAPPSEFIQLFLKSEWRDLARQVYRDYDNTRKECGDMPISKALQWYRREKENSLK